LTLDFWNLNPIFDSYLAVSVLVTGMMLLLALGPRYQQLSRGRRRVLVALRLTVILLLLVAMLRPTHISTAREPQTAVLLVLFDQSRSMQLPSGSGDNSRWQAQLETFEQARGDLADLARDVEVKLYAYDSQLQAIEFANGEFEFPAQPQGEQTDIGTSLHVALQEALGKRVAGVVLLGDGAQTAFTPQVEVQQAARELARLDYPLYTVTFGPLGDTAQSRDVAVENLPERYTVFVKNELLIKGAVRVRGYVNQEIPVELVVEDPAGNQSVVRPLPLMAREDGQQLPVELPFVPELPGQYKLTLRVAQQSGELVTRNNELSAFLTVLEGGLRVLYLYGDLMGEQRLLRVSIDSSPDMQLDALFLDPRNRTRWPVQLKESLAPDNFDVLLIENVDATALGAANLQTIATAVEQGKGLIMIGGFNSFGPGGYQNTPLARALPVVMGRFEHQDISYDRPVSRDLHWWGQLTMVPTRPHSVTRLATGEENQLVWQGLPPLTGANKFLETKPYAELLAATPDGKPLLVAGDYGGGRVLAFAGNTTIHWWQYGRQLEHRRFWRQVVLWLARREDLTKSDVWIKLAQRRFNPGARVTFTCGAQSATGDVIRDAEFRAELLAPDGTRSPVQLSSARDQFVAALDGIGQPGDYLIQVAVTRQGQTLGTVRASFQVLDRDIELSNPAANHGQMERLANLTEEAGGRAVAPEQLPGLLREIKDRRHEQEIEIQSKWQLGDTAADAWLFFLCVVGLVSAEWTLRKRWGLV